MRDERVTASQLRTAEQSHRIVRYIIGAWNAGIGALLAMIGLLTSDPLFTLIAVATLVLGVGLLLGKRWAWIAALILTMLTIFVMVTYSSGYGYSVAIIQGVMFLGLVYAGPAFGEQQG